MAGKDGTRTNARKKSGKLTYFFLNGDLDGKTTPLLHKSLHIQRGADEITTWCYPLAKRVVSSYTYTKKYRQPAFTTKEVCQMLMRGRTTIECAITDGNISEPQFTYGLDENRRKYQYMWNEQNILEAHAYLSSIHRGRPRRDGKISSAMLPTIQELRAMIRQEEVLYVRGDDGEFRPVWRAPDFN